LVNLVRFCIVIRSKRSKRLWYRNYIQEFIFLVYCVTNLRVKLCFKLLCALSSTSTLRNENWYAILQVTDGRCGEQNSLVAKVRSASYCRVVIKRCAIISVIRIGAMQLGWGRFLQAFPDLAERENSPWKYKFTRIRRACRAEQRASIFAAHILHISRTLSRTQYADDIVYLYRQLILQHVLVILWLAIHRHKNLATLRNVLEMFLFVRT